MNVALVEHAEHDVDREQGRGDQHRLAGKRLLESGGRAREDAVHRRRHVDVLHGLRDRPGRIAQGHAGLQIE